MLSQAQLLRNNSRTILPNQPIIQQNESLGWWYYLARYITFFVPDCVVRRFFKKESDGQIQAWREKLALCILIVLNCTFLAGITYGINKYICNNSTIITFNKIKPDTFKDNIMIANGMIYNTKKEFKLDNYTHLFRKSSGACAKVFWKTAGFRYFKYSKFWSSV